MKTYRRLFIFLLSIWTSSLPAQAEPGLSPKQIELLRRREQEETEALRRFQEESRRFLAPSKLKVKTPKKTPPPQSADQKGKKSKCIQIYNIHITGDSALSKSDAYELTKDWQGYCLGNREFTALLRGITQYYVQRGYLTTRAYLLPQDLRNGELKIKVIPGIIGSIRFAEGQGYASEILTAFPFLKGDRLYLRSLEQGLEQLNKLPSNRARLEIQGAQGDGASNVIIHNKADKFLRTAVVLDNSGSGSIGKYAASYNLELDSPFFLNDYWSLNIQENVGPADFEDYKRSRSLQFRIPFGYFQASAFLSRFLYQSTLKSHSGQLKNKGGTNTQNFSLEATLHRSQKSKTILGYNNKLRRSENFLNEILLRVSSHSLRSQGYSLSHSRGFKKAHMNLNLTYHKGKLNEREKAEQAPFAPALEFEKTNLGLSYRQTFFYGKQKLNWQLSLQGQNSGDILFSGEQFGIGGLHSVRGFKEQSANGDKGFYIRNEIHWAPATSNPPTAWLLWGTPSFFVGYDLGMVKLELEDEQKTQLQGIALGFRHQSPYSYFSLTLSRSLRQPSHFKKEEALYFSLRLMY